MGDNGIPTDSSHAGAMTASTSNHRIRKSVCEMGGGGGEGGGAALPGPVLGPALGENAVAEGVTLKSDRGDVNGICREVEVGRCCACCATWAGYTRSDGVMIHELSDPD